MHKIYNTYISTNIIWNIQHGSYSFPIITDTENISDI